MARVYLSSTFQDLEEHRTAVADALRVASHEVVMMEYLGAKPRRPLDVCREDVAQSDLYVGVFAWRYGYVPPEGEGKSITELELREAEARGIPRLIFLLDEHAPWPASQIDEDRTRIKRLRAELGTDYTLKTFREPADLATAVLAAVGNALGPADASPSPDFYKAYVRELGEVEEYKIRICSLTVRSTPVLGLGAVGVGFAMNMVPVFGLGGLLLASVAPLALPTLLSARRRKALLDACCTGLQRRPPDQVALANVRALVEADGLRLAAA